VLDFIDGHRTAQTPYALLLIALQLLTDLLALTALAFRQRRAVIPLSAAHSFDEPLRPATYRIPPITNCSSWLYELAGQQSPVSTKTL